MEHGKKNNKSLQKLWDAKFIFSYGSNSKTLKPTNHNMTSAMNNDQLCFKIVLDITA